MSYRIVDRGIVPEEYRYKENVRPLDKPWFGPEKPDGFILGYVTDCLVHDAVASKESFIGVIVALLNKFKNL